LQWSSEVFNEILLLLSSYTVV